MADWVSIANLAASKIGEDDQIRAPDADTHLARSVRAVWDIVRQATLRDHPWNFAIVRAPLAAEALASVPYPWAYSFPLPATNLRLIEVLNLSARSDYQLEGRSILTNVAGPLYVRHIADVVEPALWDAAFVEAFASRLAFQISDRITGDRGRKADCWKSYEAALSQAKRVDALENPAVPFEATSWETARWGIGDDEAGDWGAR